MPGWTVTPAEEALLAHVNETGRVGNDEERQMFELASSKIRVAKIKVLDVPDVQHKRRWMQPKFKMPYETGADIRLRLQGTLIWIGPELYYVRDIRQVEAEQWLIIEDDQGRSFRVEYFSTPGIDLRTPEPQYVTLDDFPVYFTRKPTRQQQQGVSHSNCAIKRVGEEQYRTFNGNRGLMRAMKKIDACPWNIQYADLMTKLRVFRALRLSSDTAVYRDDDDILKVEYRGRFLGTLEGNVVIVDNEDYDKPWIKNDLQIVGCEMKTV
jgi:hypothetical protein